MEGIGYTITVDTTENRIPVRINMVNLNRDLRS